MAVFGRTSARNEQQAQAVGRWLRRRHPFAIASFVLGLFSLIEGGVLVVIGLAGLVLGVVALRRISPDGPLDRGRVLAWAGIVLSMGSLVVAVLLYRA